jgi:hypothetical protein
MTQAQALVVEIEFQHVGDFVYASSRDVPGLHVCGGNRDEACESAVSAIKYLFKHNRGMKVDVRPAADDFESFAQPMQNCDRFIALAA